MRRRYFEVLSAALNFARTNYHYHKNLEDMQQQHEHDCRAVADTLARLESEFDRERFLFDCGVR